MKPTNKPKTKQTRGERRKFVERIVNFATEVNTFGRGVGWTIDTLTEELDQLIEKEIDKALKAYDRIL